LSDEVFQEDLAEWLMAGAIEEGNAVKDRILTTMGTALADSGASPEQIDSFRKGYFDSVEKMVFANPILAQWRHQLSLDYLRGQVAVLRQRADEAAGFYSKEKQRAALDRYCEKALSAWDIIDLSNLPEGDIHMATQKLLLRQLYMPLRIEVEPKTEGQSDEEMLARIEFERESRRRREAGHLAIDESNQRGQKTEAPVGERLATSRRLVVLGDPGGGKTTMLRWMATAYLLRHKGDDAFSQVPDTETLPAKPWIPVLIRCRDLGEADLCRCFVDFLAQHLNKTELQPDAADVMWAVILERIANGQALLLVDGLDEITNPRVRMMFCQELERTAARYPDAPIVVTSRIVGYRDMPYRMGSGFEHGQIAELNREDKDLFARRWVDVTEQHQSPEERVKRAQELLDALHSSDRIERLTGNPMLLTTVALVKRKVGKLPNKRTKLYAEAVSVLLNWNPRFYQAIEEDEAIPQLEYLAYEMCQRGVQRLPDDEVLDLLDRLRTEYPNVRSVKRREPQAFLELIEARSSILIKSGGIWDQNVRREKPVWEFRHLTFQEFLGARALLDGRYSGRDKFRSLAEQVGPLAGVVEKTKPLRARRKFLEENDVPESWREALRLLVADCRDDDVDDVLNAILNPLDGEDPKRTTRPRAVLATLCLADEPNVSPEVATSILRVFTKSIRPEDGMGHVNTSLERAAVEVATSLWSQQLKRHLIEEFIRRKPTERMNPGGLWAMAEVASWRRSGERWYECSQDLLRRLNSGDQIEVISSALTIMEAAYEGVDLPVDGFLRPLLCCLKASDPQRHAAAWAFMQLALRPMGKRESMLVGEEVVTTLGEAIQNTDSRESEARRFLAITLGHIRGRSALEPLLAILGDQNDNVRYAVIEALGRLGDNRAVTPLLAKLDDQNEMVRYYAAEALGRLGDKRAVAPLMAKLDDQNEMVRQIVIEALGRLGDKRAVAPLMVKLDDQNEMVRNAVAEALEKLGK
jgi:hypothetical protein